MTDAIDRATVFKGEALLLRWNESARGRSITLQLDPHVGSHHPFKNLKCGENGQRLGLAVILIGDDEQPQNAGGAQRSADKVGESRTVRAFRELPASQQCAIKCQDPAFQDWLRGFYKNNWYAANGTYELGPDGAEQADRALKRQLCINSKRELDTCPESGDAWRHMLTDFDYRNQIR